MGISKFLILCLGLLSSSMVQSMRFDLLSSTTKCISEDIIKDSLTVGTYSVVNPNEGSPLPETYMISVMVTSPNGDDYHHKYNVDSGNFALTASESGEYVACFWVADHKPVVTISLDFDWKTGYAAKDWSTMAKKGKIDMMEFELEKMLDVVTSIHNEMYILREREEEMQLLNRSTNSNMASLTLLSLLVCLSVTGLQFWHLKTFFKKKKVL